MSKELEDLLRRVTELEKKLGKSNLFGANQNTIGSTSADLTLKTSGKVKIQWKNKFIDLIKDGKINVNSKFIYISDEIGTKDGIYISTDGTNVVLKVDDFSINLVGEIGTTYVSFLQKQETSSEQKHQALTNIGFLYSSIDDVTEKSLKNGIIYIESEQKLYMVQDGELTEFSIDIPNPYTKQFIIAKNDSDKGAIVIKGDGINNSLAFNNFFICNNSDQAYYSSDYGHVFAINDNTILEVKQEGVFSNLNFTSSMFSSNGATSDNGFRLYTENGHSFLEVDNLIVRNGIPKDTDLYPSYWWVDSNVISQVLDYTLGNTTEDTSEEDYQVQVELKYTNIFAIGDQLYAYVNTTEEIENPSDESAESYLNVTLRTLVQFTVVDILNNSIYLKTNNQEIDYTSLVGSILFKINSQIVLKNSNQGFDIIEATSFEEEQNINNIHTRVGNLEPLNLKIRDNNFEIDPDNTLGIYSQNSIFKNAAYSSDYVLPQDDNSSRFASTEWVKSKLSESEVDLSIYSDTISPDQYFSQQEIQSLYDSQVDNTLKTYVEYYGTLTIQKNVNGDSFFSAIVRASWKGGWSHRSINALYRNNQYISGNTYIIKEQFNPGYYYSREQSQNIPLSPVYIGINQQGFQVDSVNKYLWYTNDGEVWTLIQEYIDPVQNVLYIRTTTRNLYAIENIYCPAGFVCYSDGNNSIAIGNGRGVSNYLEVLNEYKERKPLTILQNIEDIAIKGKIPVMDGYNWLWSLKDNADPTEYDSWTLVSGIENSIPVVYELDKLPFGNCGGITSSVVWTEVDSSGVNIGPMDSSKFINGDGTESNWKNPAFVRAFLVTAFSDFLRRNIARYTDTLGWSFNYDSIVHLRGWGGYINFYIGAPENPSSDNIDSIDSLPKSVFLWVNGSVFCNGYKADFYFDSVSPGLKINVGQCYQENKDIGKTANVTTFFDITYKGLKVQVTNLPSN